MYIIQYVYNIYKNTHPVQGVHYACLRFTVICILDMPCTPTLALSALKALTHTQRTPRVTAAAAFLIKSFFVQVPHDACGGNCC